MKTIEYRVKPVTRYILTEYFSDPENGAGGVGTLGEFDHEEYANKICAALTEAERRRSFVPSSSLSEGRGGA